MELQDKVVVITGGASGLGRATADYFVGKGARVSLFDLNEEAGNAAVAELGEDNALFAVTDVTSEESVSAAVEATMEKFGAIDYLINNAAIFGNMKIEGYLNIDMDYLEKFMRVNAHGCLIMTRAVVEHMTAGGGGAIVNQSSTAAWMSTGFYGVAKLTMNGITQSLANELGWRNIRINAIAPGPTDTPALERNAGEYAQEMLKTMPIKRLGQPSDMADAALFLLSDEASWITGHILNVDGGQFMRP